MRKPTYEQLERDLEGKEAERDAYRARAEAAEKELARFRLGPEQAVRCKVLEDEGEKRRAGGLYTIASYFFMAAGSYAPDEARRRELQKKTKECERDAEAACDR